MNGNGDVIQVNGKYKSYFAVTNAPAGYTVKSVTVNFQKSSKTTFSVYGQQQAYPEADATHKGDELKKGISLNDKSYEFTASYPYFALYTVGSNAVYINDITVVWTTAGGSVETVAAPTINPASQKFSEAFDATITGAEGTTLKYTLDGTDPTTSETAKAVQAATATVNIPAATTTLKAIALKGDLVSRVAEAVYTYRAPSDNDGSFAKPYTAEEFADLKPQNVWVKGTVLGEIKNGSIGDFADFFNVTIGTEQGVHIALKLDKDSNFRNIDWQNKIGAELMAFGSYTKDYNGTKGMANEPEYLYIADPANALALIDVKTTEGYATYFNDQVVCNHSRRREGSVRCDYGCQCRPVDD